MKRKSLVVSVCAIILALTVVIGLLPAVFLLPALFTACCFGYGVSFFASTAFGVVSLIFSLPGVNLMYPTIGWYFVNNPWLPIVARMFIGPISHAFFLLMKRLIKSPKKEPICISLTAILGSLINTILVGGIILLLGSKDLPKDLDKVTVGFLVANCAIEMFATAVILPLIIFALKKSTPKLFLQMNSPIYIKKKEKAQDNQTQTEI